MATTYMMSPPLPPGTPAPEAVAWHLSGLDRPVSVAADDAGKCLFVSCRGHLAKLSFDGAVLHPEWAAGLVSPAGARAGKGLLTVACGGGAAVLDAASGTLVKRIAIPGTATPADVAIDPAGVVYTADPGANAVFADAAPFAPGEDFDRPGGLLVIGNQLFVVGAGPVVAVNLKTRQRQPVTAARVGDLVGVERDEKFNFLTTDVAAGRVLRVSPRGEVAVLLEGLDRPGDAAYVADRRLLIVPRPDAGCVTAYDVTRLLR